MTTEELEQTLKRLEIDLIKLAAEVAALKVRAGQQAPKPVVRGGAPVFG